MTRKSRVSYEKPALVTPPDFFKKKSQTFEIPSIMAKNLWVCAKPQHCHLCTVKKSISTRCLIISGFIRLNSAKCRSKKIVGQTERQKMAPGFSPAKKRPRHKSGCNYNSKSEPTFDWVRRSDRGKQQAYCTVGSKHFSVSHGANDNVRKHGVGKKHNELYNARNKSTKVTNYYVSIHQLVLTGVLMLFLICM